MAINVPEYLGAAQPRAAAAQGCVGCQASCEVGSGSACASCMSTSCQVPCQWGCQSTCEVNCQNCQGVACQTCEGCQGAVCQTACQTNCEKTCQTGCQVACETGCQVACQNCQGAACQVCQTACQGAPCQTCQTACETSVQATSTYSWKFNPVTSDGNSADKVVRGLWSGIVAGREVLCAACNGYLWQLSLAADGTWSKTSCGQITTTSDVFMFGFGEKMYLLNGTQYKVWDGSALSEVVGYRPMVSVSVPPNGGGKTLEGINKLCGMRRCKFSPDGSATVFMLPEKGIASVDYVSLNGVSTASGWSADTATGKVTFTTAPPSGTNSLEIGWTFPTNSAASVRSMRFAELYNGAQDSRIFVYGDGTNKAFYSGIDYDGVPRADYFPDLNEVAVGDDNVQITAMIRHYSRLLAFKLDSTWSISYGGISLPDGTATAGFFVTPVNRDVGCCSPGQAELVENRPRTLDGRSVIEWRSSDGNINADERNARRISQRVDGTIRTFDLTAAKTYYDKYAHEYYVIGPNGTALVNGVDADAWYVYTNFDARCQINYKDEMYFGTSDGYLRHFSDEYTSDDGAAIDALWESGAMSFGEDFKRKYSAMLWIGIKPENNGYLSVTAETDTKSDFAELGFKSDVSGAVPKMTRIKLKAKKFTYYKLILSNNSATATATVVSADLRVRGTGYVR